MNLLQAAVWQYRSYYQTGLFDKALSVDGIDAYLKETPTETLIVMPGSHTGQDWWRDAEALLPYEHPILGTIPYGFQIGTDALFDAMRPLYTPGKPVHFILHSLSCPRGMYQAALFTPKGFCPSLPGDITITAFEPPRSCTQTAINLLKPIPNITLTRNTDPEGGMDIVLDVPSWASHPRPLTQIGSEPISGNLILDKDIHAIQAVMVSCELLEAQNG